MSRYELPRGPLVDENGALNPAWAFWFSRTNNSAKASQESGPTSERPTTLLWIGRPYFDTTLNIPIWVQSVPAKPAPAVWCDATGSPV